MKLIIETTELDAFAEKVGTWYHECLTYIVEHWNPTYHDDRSPIEQLRNLRAKFSQEHTKPHWKSLL